VSSDAITDGAQLMAVDDSATQTAETCTRLYNSSIPVALNNCQHGIVAKGHLPPPSPLIAPRFKFQFVEKNFLFVRIFSSKNAKFGTGNAQFGGNLWAKIENLSTLR